MRFLLGLWLGIAMAMQPHMAGADPLEGAALYADVERYDGFGPHRYGSAGAEQALAWIAAELARAGLAVSEQRFAMARQYDFAAGTLQVGEQALPVLPQWWIPEGAASFHLTAPLIAAGEAPGAFVRVRLAYEGGAYLTAAHRAALQGAFDRHPAAVLLAIDHPSGEIFTYNVDQAQPPWPVPVILVPPREWPALDAAEAAGRPLGLSISGGYRRDVPGHNVIGRLDRGKGRSVVIS